MREFENEMDTKKGQELEEKKIKIDETEIDEAVDLTIDESQNEDAWLNVGCCS